MKRFIPGLLMMAVLAGACGPKPATETGGGTATTTTTTTTTSTPTPASTAPSDTVGATTASPGMETPAGMESPGMEPTTGGGDTLTPPPGAGGPPPAGTQKSLPSGVKYTEMAPGTGATAEKGKTVFVNYTGWLTNGEKFDSSADHGKPIDFVLGAGNVIPGWEQGVEGMKVGEKRRLEIPPDQAYGAAGIGPIPPNATLIFEVELVDVK